MRKTAILAIGLLAALVGTARAVLKNRASQDQDQIDLAVVAAKRKIRMRAKPFLGATILVAIGAAELDLRRVVPAPTGVEISMLVFGGALRVVIPPDWEVVTAVSLKAARVVGASGSSAAAFGDRPVVRLEGSAWFGRIEVVQRSAPIAVAS